jgi:hypothetical protein
MSPQPTGMTKTGTIVTGSAAKKGLIGGHARADPSTANGAGFPAYLELLNSLAYGLVGGIVQTSVIFCKYILFLNPDRIFQESIQHHSCFHLSKTERGVLGFIEIPRFIDLQ